MQPGWQIRQATENDAEGLKRCMQSAYRPYQDRMDGVNLPPMDTDYLSEIKNYPCWVVESDCLIVGGLIMSFNNHQASLANIAIDPRYQGQGIGGALMRFAEARAKAMKFTELNLATHVLLHENLSLYLHLGWKETGRDETRVFMQKDIGCTGK